MSSKKTASPKGKEESAKSKNAASKDSKAAKDAKSANKEVKPVAKDSKISAKQSKSETADKNLPAKVDEFEAELTRSGSWAKVSGGPVFACIDMGTNSFHMIVCRATDDKDDFEVLAKVKDIAPFFRRALGAHFIDDVAFDAAKSILRDMMKQATSKGATYVQAVATSAVRESRNGMETIERIRQELKLDARTISGKEEARLIYLGVLFSMPELNERFVVIDIGGGSTEIVCADRQKSYFAESYKLGGARLTYRFFKKGFPTQDALKALHGEVTGMLKPAAARIEAVGGYKRVIGTSGTVQALAKLDRVQMGKTNEPLHGWRMPIDRLAEIVAYIERCSVGGERIKGVSADRSQTILAGAIVLLEIMRALKADEITVCSSALREGVVVDRFLQTGWLDDTDLNLKSHRDPRSTSVHELLEKYDSSFEHAEQVAKLASIIFQQTKGILHDHDEEVGHILWSAAMLHDVGTFIARNGHHKHSYYLIRHGGMLGHSEEQLEMIASIARYHRGSTPKESHEAWQALPITAQPIVQDLAAILRVAEALDRSHRQVIKELKVMMNPYQGTDTTFGGKMLSLVPFVKDGENCKAEAWALNEKKAYFETRFGVKLHFLLEASQAVR